MNKNAYREKHQLEQSFFYRLRNRSKLAELLGLEKSFFRRKYFELISYRTTTIPKKNGGERTINDPSSMLKTIQRKILMHLSRIYKPKWLISGRRGFSYIDNAKFHGNPSSVVTLDIKAFYDNCSRGKVYKLFSKQFLMSSDLAKIITDLVTFNNCIPQGSPTGQIIAFYTHLDTFIRINKLAKTYNCIFSLYVDDMTFSSDSEVPLLLLQRVETELRAAGLSIKWSKAKRFRQGQCKLITGGVIDSRGCLKVTNALRNKIIKGITKIKKEAVSEEEYNKEILSLKGRISSARMIEPKIFESIQKELP